MREAIGGAYIFQIVVVFILLFTGFMSLSINYSRAFAVSTEIANIIERENGFNQNIEQTISEYLIDVGYKTKGECDEHDGEGINVGAGTSFGSGTKYNYCINKVSLSATCQTEECPVTAYYRIKVFYKLDLPILSMFFEFDIKNSTKKLYYPIGD